MAKKKTKKAKKVSRVKKLKKTLKPKKIKKLKNVKKVVRTKKPKGEKVLGRIEHLFDKISVAAIGVKAPFKVGDYIHIKGHTTDFIQKVESMQIEHQNVAKVKKGDDVGIKVKEFVRPHDMVYLAAQPKEVASQPARPAVVQEPIFPAIVPQKPMLSAKPAEKQKSDPYSNTKFLKF